MGRAREIRRIQSYSLQNLHWWGYDNVAHTMLSVSEREDFSVDFFNKRWCQFKRYVLNPLTGGRWIRFMELQKRGAPHAHVLHFVEGQIVEHATLCGESSFVSVQEDGP
jgi:hypothetical protein